MRFLLPILMISGALRAATPAANPAVDRAVKEIVTKMRRGTLRPIAEQVRLVQPQPSGACSVRLTEIKPPGGSNVMVLPIVPPGKEMAKMPAMQLPAPPCALRP